MNTDALSGMIDKTFAFALRRTFSREEAEELTQEILFQAVKSLGTLQEEAKFEPWYWQLADNTLKAFRRGQARGRDWLSFDDVTLPPYEEEPVWEKDENLQNLRRQISFLSANYRDILVLHYYDNLTCKQIAQRLGVPEGTVTYRLAAARDKLKKRCETMNETALHPMTLKIRIAGEGDYNGEDRPFPWQFVCDALSQNILWYAYRTPRSVEELAALTGVPAFYIEDTVENLLRREALMRPAKRTVQTDFLIFDDRVRTYETEQRVALAREVAPVLYPSAKKLAEQMIALPIDTAGRPFDVLLCLFTLLALDESAAAYSPVACEKIGARYDGGRWEYRGEREEGAMDIGVNKNLNCGEPDSWMHYVYCFPPFRARRMMRSQELAVCAALLRGDALDRTQKEIAARMVAEGYCQREQSGVKVMIPALSAQHYAQFHAFVAKDFAEFLPVYRQKLQQYMQGYIRCFPAHLEKAAARSGQFLFVSLFRQIAEIWQRQGLLQLPDGADCDVLIARGGAPKA